MGAHFNHCDPFVTCVLVAVNDSKGECHSPGFFLWATLARDF
jgi:hypothetical protein